MIETRDLAGRYKDAIEKMSEVILPPGIALPESSPLLGAIMPVNPILKAELSDLALPSEHSTIPTWYPHHTPLGVRLLTSFSSAPVNASIAKRDF